MDSERRDIAVWALTPNAVATAKALGSHPAFLGRVVLFMPERFRGDRETPHEIYFTRFGESVRDRFTRFSHHVFIMAAGIVVRLIAPLIRHKTKDPSVVVMDEKGAFAISLLSGHIGGANALCRKIGTAIQAQPVITTATDVNGKPAIDEIAVRMGLAIENPEKIKAVNMAILMDEPIGVYDPYRLISGERFLSFRFYPADPASCDIFISDTLTTALDSDPLILRPGLLAVGIGCNRGTPKEEMESLLVEVFRRFNLSTKSIVTLASIDLKADEKGLQALAMEWGLPIAFFSRIDLNQAKGVITSSTVVEKYTGAKSVCEAAAILSSNAGTLVVPKTKTKNATLAVARRPPSSIS